MTVFVIWFKNFQSEDELVGIFETEEGAKDFMKKYDDWDRSTMRIEPYELDG